MTTLSDSRGRDAARLPGTRDHPRVAHRAGHIPFLGDTRTILAATERPRRPPGGPREGHLVAMSPLTEVEVTASITGNRVTVLARAGLSHR